MGGVDSRRDSPEADRAGWTLARDEKKETQVFREILGSLPPYRSVLEWTNHQQMSTVTAVDVAVHWHEHHRAVVADANDNTLRENAVCFFNLLQAAALGKMTLGRGGKPTRVDLDLDALRAHVEAGPTAPPWQGQADIEDPNDAIDPSPEHPPDKLLPPESEEPALSADPIPAEALRVFISHGKNHDIVEQIETMLGLADFESEVAEKEETTAIPVPDKVLDAMRRCQAGIIAVTVDETRKDDAGSYVLNETS